MIWQGPEIDEGQPLEVLGRDECVELLTHGVGTKLNAIVGGADVAFEVGDSRSLSSLGLERGGAWPRPARR
jgi:hypothetical protein